MLMKRLSQRLVSKLRSLTASMRAIGTLIVAFLLVVSFQNCGDGFKAINMVTLESTGGLDVGNELPVKCSPGATVACSIPNGHGAKTCNAEGDAYGVCSAHACSASYDLVNGACTAKLCAVGESVACTGANGTGAQLCKPDGLGYGECLLNACSDGYRLMNNVCVMNSCVPGASVACEVPNGRGTKMCDGQGAQYGACVASVCNSGFALESGKCDALPVEEISMGYFDFFYIGVLKNGVLKSYGWDLSSHINISSRPAQVGNLTITGLTSVSKTAFFGNCAVIGGALHCCNKAGDGCANAPAGENPYELVPEFASGVTAVAVGPISTCVVVNGGLSCYGSNYSGQLGLGDTLGHPGKQNTVFPANSGVTQAAVGENYACAVVNGSVQCWGDIYTCANKAAGEACPPPPANDILSRIYSMKPVMRIASGATKVAVGWGSRRPAFTCAIVNGALVCWYNYGSDEAAAPRTLIASGVTDIAAGTETFCAVASGALKCFKASKPEPNVQPVFTDPVTLAASGATKVAIGIRQGCALVNNSVKCFVEDLKPYDLPVP